MLRNAAAYESDFHAWTQEQARLLREGRVAELDLRHLAEEIEGMGGSERREVRSRLTELVLHLLTWLHLPSHRTPSWRHGIRKQREALAEIFEDSASLRHVADEAFSACYRKGRLNAADETGLPLRSFPADPLFTLAQALDPLFPDDLGGPEREETGH